MDAQDEKFFASLAGAKSDADENYEVEVAKADGAVMARTARSTPHVREDWSPDEGPEGQLTVDVYQTPAEIVVESAIAGVKPEDIDINVTPDSISIKGSRRREKRTEEEDYLYQECYWGRFARSIILPQEVDPENADVTFKNGILTVRLPKANKKKSRKLRVRVE
jgi:HSP20 family protein